MRTIEEIKVDHSRAFAINDPHALWACGEEFSSLGTPRSRAFAQDAFGMSLMIRGRFAEAREHYHQALQLFEELHDISGVARSAGSIGSICLSIGEHDQALEHYQRALALSDSIDDRFSTASVTGNIGSVYQATGNYPRALEYYERSLAVYEELEEFAAAATVTGNIGVVHYITGNYARALEFFESALAFHEQIGDRFGVARVTNSIGNVYKVTGELKSALKEYERALALHEELGSSAGVAHDVASLGALLAEMGEYERAQELLHVLDGLEIDAPVTLMLQSELRAAIQEHKNDVQVAVETLLSALELAKRHAFVEGQAAVHKQLRDLAFKQQDLTAYVEHNDRYLSISEEINGKRTAQRIAVMDAEKKMAVERKEHEKERALLYGALPEHIANRMLGGDDVSGDYFDEASVLFLDIVGFTALSDKLSPTAVVQMLRSIFTVCEEACLDHGIIKIKTIGDSFMAAGGVPEPTSDHTMRTAQAAIQMMRRLSELKASGSIEPIAVRIGLHCGPLVAGIVGTQRLQYDIWGDTVNVASRMESTGEPGRIQCSEVFASVLSPSPSHVRERGAATRHPDGGEADEGPQANTAPLNYRTVERGTVEVKGKGLMQTYWLEASLP